MTQTHITAPAVTSAEPDGEPLPSLPPYSGDENRCVKCGNTGAFTIYQPAATVMAVRASGSLRRGPLPERLERRCTRCDYWWDEALQGTPAPVTAPVTTADLAYALQQSAYPYAVTLHPQLVEHMAAGLMAMFRMELCLAHPVWASASARPALAVPSEMHPADPSLCAQVPMFMPGQNDAPAAVVPVPLHDKPQPPVPPAGPTAYGHGGDA